MAAHNMKALSPEALPESPARSPPPRDATVLQGAPAFRHDRVRYSYDTPQHIGLLQSMLAHAHTLPSEPSQQGVHTRRPVNRPHQQQQPPTHRHATNGQPYLHDFEPPTPHASVQIQSSYHSAPPPPTLPPTMMGMLETSRNDGWGSQGSPGLARNLHDLPPAHSPEAWSLRAVQTRRDSGEGGGFQAFRDLNSHSRDAGPVMHPLGSLGPDSQRFIV